MGLNSKKNPLLYSIGTQLAYNIAKNYYGDVHYAWCTCDFNNIKQPPTSNPAKICNRYLDIISKGDRHTVEICNNIAGILRGAKAKFDRKIITPRQYKEIKTLVAAARYESFYPVLYIIQSSKVKHKCIEVPIPDRASDDAVEYRIEELQADEFDIIFLRDILGGVLSVVDKEVDK